MSGKGGVGKSSMAIILAQELNRKGYRVGIMDADITGPSIPRLLNVPDAHAGAGEFGIMPYVTESGISVVSMNMFIENEDEPVIWRGPVISGVVKQFWTDVIWGDLDYLVIDMPPGTGDVALTVMQSVPLDGIVMVSTPQEFVSMIVGKAVNMARKLNIEILGVIENMSYIICPCCNNTIRLADNENTKEFVQKNDIDLLGELPTSKEITNLSAGSDYRENKLLADIIDGIVEKVVVKTQNIK